MRRSRSCVAMSVAVLLTACAGSGTVDGGPVPQRRNVIARQQIAETNLTSVWDVIQRLRGRWLRAARGATVLPAVYVGRQYWGELDTLRRMSASTVDEIRYLTAREARNQGWNSDGGVIQIIRRTGPGGG